MINKEEMELVRETKRLCDDLIELMAVSANGAETEKGHHHVSQHLYKCMDDVSACVEVMTMVKSTIRKQKTPQIIPFRKRQ